MQIKLKTPVTNTEKRSQKKERMYLLCNKNLGKMKTINKYVIKIWGTRSWNVFNIVFGALRKKFISGLAGEMKLDIALIRKKQNQNNRCRLMRTPLFSENINSRLTISPLKVIFLPVKYRSSKIFATG